MKRFEGGQQRASFKCCSALQIKGFRKTQKRFRDDKKKHKDTQPQKPHKYSHSLKQPHTSFKRRSSELTHLWLMKDENRCNFSLSHSFSLSCIKSQWAIGTPQFLCLHLCWNALDVTSGGLISLLSVAVSFIAFTLGVSQNSQLSKYLVNTVHCCRLLVHLRFKHGAAMKQ